MSILFGSDVGLYNIKEGGRSSDICTTLWYNFYDNFSFLSFDWSKIIERKRKRENKKIMWV